MTRNPWLVYKAEPFTVEDPCRERLFILIYKPETNSLHHTNQSCVQLRATYTYRLTWKTTPITDTLPEILNYFIMTAAYEFDTATTVEGTYHHAS